MKSKFFTCALLVIVILSFLFNNTKSGNNDISVSQIFKISTAIAQEGGCVNDEKDVTKTVGCERNKYQEECQICESGTTDCSPGPCCH